MNNVYIHPIDNYVKAISDQNKMVFEAQMKEITSNKINTMQEKIKNQKKLLKEKDKEIERLTNIIKELREYITYWHYRNDFRINSFTTSVKKKNF